MAAYVKKADGDVIRIERLANSIRASLEGLGFSDAHGRQLELLATDDMAQATILDRLRIMGSRAFSRQGMVSSRGVGTPM